ncbi:MAG: hypothetical protein AAGA20_12425 [Planctomycetota bacterium]
MTKPIPHLDVALENTLEQAKAHARSRGDQEVRRGDFLEAAIRVNAELTESILLVAGVDHGTLRRVAHRAAEHADDAGGGAPMALSICLSIAIESEADSNAGPVTLAAALRRVTGAPDFELWLDDQYGSGTPPEPFETLDDFVEFLAEFMGQARLASQGHLEAHCELERIRATGESRWAASSPKSAPVSLYECWGLEPLSDRAAALESVLVQWRDPSKESPSIRAILHDAERGRGYAVGTDEVLAGLDDALVFGLLQKVQSTPEDGAVTDRLLPTLRLLKQLAESQKAAPIQDRDRAQLRLGLDAR